jgi:long-subunit acyl-CoA synthetase (AMP-forming)
MLNPQKSIIVGLLANSSTDYLLTIYGLVKLGVVVFPLSIRNSKAALEHLIKTTGVSYLIVGPGQIHIELDGLKIIPLENVYWNDNNNSFSCSINKMQKDSLEQVQLILHRYIKLFFILSVILLLIVVRVQHLFQNQFGLLIDRS